MKYKELSQDQRNAMETLRLWIYELYSEHNVKDYYKLYSWLKEMKPNTEISDQEYDTLRHLWNVYVDYIKQKNNLFIDNNGD